MHAQGAQSVPLQQIGGGLTPPPLLYLPSQVPPLTQRPLFLRPRRPPLRLLRPRLHHHRHRRHHLLPPQLLELALLRVGFPLQDRPGSEWRSDRIQERNRGWCLLEHYLTYNSPLGLSYADAKRLLGREASTRASLPW